LNDLQAQLGNRALNGVRVIFIDVGHVDYFFGWSFCDFSQSLKMTSGAPRTINL
jgi:hypothetical protein